MTELPPADVEWTPDGPSDPPAPLPQPRGWVRRRWWVLALALVVALTGAGVAGWLFLRRDPGPSFPDAWDPRVLPLVHVVEQERGLSFRHPIYVDFLSDKDFEQQVTSDESDLTDQDRKEIQQATGELRAIGLLEGDVDLLAQMNDLSAAGVIGLYSFDDKRIRVRGSVLTPAVKSTLVHELTHALQDQQFDLKAKTDALKDSKDEGGLVLSAIIEGDAVRIEQKYRESLSAADRAALDKEQADRGTEFDTKAKDIPQILQTMMGAPYDLGVVLLHNVVERQSEEGVNDLFVHPPVHTDQLLDPWTIGDGDQVLAVPPVDLQPGEEKQDDGEFGALTWYLMLAERIPVTEALDATDGWAGDAYVQFDKAGTTCIRVGYRGETATDVTQMRRALGDWIAAAPESPASVEDAGAGLVFQSCDPGPGQHVGKNRSQEALGLEIYRAQIGTLIAGQLGDHAARCYADRVVHTFSLEQLQGFDRSGLTDTARTQLQQLAASCAGT